MYLKVRLADIKPEPWKNGLGMTQELLVWPHAHAWRVRLSLAKIGQSGEFSQFEHVKRWFTIIQGEGLDLCVDGRVIGLTASSPAFGFDGGLSCQAMLRDETVHAFNVMFGQGYHGSVIRVVDQGVIALGAIDCLGVFCVEPTRGLLGLDALNLGPGDLVWFTDLDESSGSLVIECGHCVVVLGGTLQ
jgi:environmental stress-induced protein Ves